MRITLYAMNKYANVTIFLRKFLCFSQGKNAEFLLTNWLGSANI